MQSNKSPVSKYFRPKSGHIVEEACLEWSWERMVSVGGVGRPSKRESISSVTVSSGEGAGTLEGSRVS